MFEGVCTAAYRQRKLVRVPAPGPHYTLAPSGVLASPNTSHVRGKQLSLTEKDTSLQLLQAETFDRCYKCGIFENLHPTPLMLRYCYLANTFKC